MNLSSKELKRIARENLTGKYNIPMGAFVTASLITLAIELPFSMLQGEQTILLQDITYYAAEFLIALIGIVLIVGQLRIHLAMARKQDTNIKPLFESFRNHPDHILLASLLLLLFGAIANIPSMIGLYFFIKDPAWNNLLWFIPAIIVSFILTLLIKLHFEFVYFLLADHPQMNIMECMKTSVSLMKGNKLQLLYIMLSFLGMDLLMLLSLGIGSLWIMPYRYQTYTLFYLDRVNK